MTQGSGTATIDGRVFAVGLLWQKTTSASDARAKLQRRASSLSVDLISFRTGRSKGKRVMQYGVGCASDGLRVRQPALAACLADRVGPGTVVGAWPVDGGRWVVVAVRDGLILPEGDALCADEAAARRKVVDYLDAQSLAANALGVPDRLWLPANWGNPPGLERAEISFATITEILGKASGYRLAPVVVSKLPMYAATVVFVAGIAGLGGFLLWSSGVVPDAPLMPTMTLAKEPPPPPPPPWWNTVLPADLTPICPAALDDVPSLPGFSFSGLTCSAGQSSVSYVRAGYGTLLSLDLMSSPGLRVVDKDRVQIDRPVTLPKKERHDETPWSFNRLIRQIHGVGQYFGTRVELNEITPPAPPPGADAPPPPPYRSFRFVLAGTDPRVIVKHLTAPTLVVSAVAFDQTGWKIQGEVYAAR